MSSRRTGLWRHGDFVRLWSAATISVFGSMVSAIALPLVAILTLDAGPAELAGLAVARMLPDAVFALVAGVWADRVRRRRLLIVTDLARAAIVLWIPVAAVAGWLDLLQLYVVALGTGVLTSVFDVAHHAFVPRLVERRRLVEANAKLTGGGAVAEACAFAAGGWLVQLLTAPIAFVFDSATFVVSALCLMGIRTPEPPPHPSAMGRRLRMDTAAGARAIVHSPVLRAIAIGVILRGVAYGIFLTLYMLFCIEVLGFGPGFLGLIFAVGSVSSLAAAALANRVERVLGLGRSIVLGYGVLGVALALIPLAPDATLVGAGLLVAHQLFGDGGDTLFEITQTSLRQRLIPVEILGRVAGCMNFTSSAAILVGALVAGGLGEQLGSRAVLWLAAAAVVAGAVWLSRSSLMTR